MKIVIAAFVVLLVAGFELYRVSIPSGIPGAVASNVAIMVLALFLAIAGLPGPVQEQPKSAPVPAPAPVVVAPSSKEAELKNQVAQARQEVETLRASLKAKSERPESVDAEIVNLLSLLQRKGRFIDFLMDDVSQYDDAQVGAAARVVHQGLAEVLRDYFHIEPIRVDAEGTPVTLDGNYNADQNRLVGKVVGQPPFRGVVIHRGWKTTKVNLPRVVTAEAQASREIIQPAEIELT